MAQRLKIVIKLRARKLRFICEKSCILIFIYNHLYFETDHGAAATRNNLRRWCHIKFSV